MPYDMSIQPPDNLIAAGKTLNGLSYYTLLSDWTWHESANKWVLHCSLSVNESVQVPANTEWFILADEDYPWGNIELNPAKENGLICTFPHQSYNSSGKPELPWRDGTICARTPMRHSGRNIYDIEPFSVDERLLWRVTRAKDWLDSASQGRLAEKGEPFELPDFPVKTVEILGYVEEEGCCQFWEAQSAISGTALLIQPNGIDRWMAVAAYFDECNKNIRNIKYGDMLSQKKMSSYRAMWIRLTKVPVIIPWQAPATFGELRDVMGKQGLDLNSIFLHLAPNFRNGRKNLLILGFPIPAEIGGKDTSYHWQGIKLPVLSHGNLNGFRHTEKNYAKNDIKRVLADNVQIEWIESKNWSEMQIRTRGRACPDLSGSNILLVGCGAVGSSVAEILVREGCGRITLVDGDILDIGNLCRHTLSLEHVCKYKATSLAKRLHCISPHATVQALCGKFNRHSGREKVMMMESKIIIDCTGDDALACQLESFPWQNDKLFLSISLGIKARRLFLFSAQGRKFPYSEFRNLITPWLMKELDENKGLHLPREGIGCWHPVFPARSDDIWMMSAFAAKCIDMMIKQPLTQPLLNVYEQDWEDNLFLGIRKAVSP